MSKTGAKPAAKARAKATVTEPAADGAPDLNLEAVAERIRELNERIIASSMQAGETTINSYAKMLDNIAQLTERRDAFGLDSDTKRAVRLLFQPLLVAWALAATDAGRVLLGARRSRSTRR